MIHYFRAAFRLTFFAFGAGFYISRYLIKSIFVGYNLDRGLRLRKELTNILIPVLGIEIEVFGDLPIGGGLLVCNHRSYFDPFIIFKDIHALPVGKAEIKKWPIIGTAAQVSGAIFVDRSDLESRRKTRKSIAETIQKGYFVINYPEGTTHTQAQTIPFKKGMFEDAADQNIKVYPIALEYQNENMAFVGDDTFVPHFFKAFGSPKTKIKVSYGKSINLKNAEEIRNKSKQWIDDELFKLRQNWHLATQKN
jgi:1-acyl-sn-glycerol-3-phosphate acyltransferase